MKQTIAFLLGVCCLLLVSATPSDAAAIQSALPWMVSASPMPPTAGACPSAQEASTKDKPSFFAASVCSLSVECDDGSVISCGGNSCQTSSDGRCAICDGVTAGCCALTCCEVCEQNLDNCLNNCVKCNVCNTAYGFCVNHCTGGCNY